MSNELRAKITFISAGAGSGKTHRLTELLHEELASGGIRPSAVMAMTFTRKAASELRERVRGHLLESGQYQLAAAMGSARIGTVNSVCGQLIERFSFEAGVSPDLQVLEDQASKALLSQAMEATLACTDLIEMLALANRLGLDEGGRHDKKGPKWLQDLKALVDQIRFNDIDLAALPAMGKSNADDLLSYFPPQTTLQLDDKLACAIRDALPELTSVAESGRKKNTGEYLALVLSCLEGLDAGNLPWAAWPRLHKKAPEVALQSTIEPINDLVSLYAEHPRLRSDLSRYLSLMFDLAAHTLTAFQTLKREQGGLDFADQEHLLLRILDDEQVQSVLADELDLLMVDEFQDTSPIQLALFMKLARLAKRVYWVGDIKQAIYGFRGSDTQLMRSILDALPALGANKEILQDSWRSRPPLVKLVNAAFTNAFASTLPPQEVMLNPKRTEFAQTPAVAQWQLNGKKIEHENLALAQGVQKLVRSGSLVQDKASGSVRPVTYRDIAILCRMNDGVAALAAVLASRGIPVSTEQAGLLGKPEAVLMLACLRRLIDAGDTVATAEIVSMVDGTPPEDWVSHRMRHLAASGHRNEWMEIPSGGEAPHRVLSVIAHMRGALALLTPKEAVEQLIAACGLASVVLSWSQDADLGRARLVNLESLIDLAQQYEDQCRASHLAASIAGLLVWLQEMGTREEDWTAPSSIDAVHVMTHHAAKGLEWPVVILLDLDSDTKDRLWSVSAVQAGAFDVSQPLTNRAIRYWPWPFGQQSKLDLADDIAKTPVGLAFREAAVDERKRLLYVSMTRARDLLIIATPSKAKQLPWLQSIDAPWLLPVEGVQHIKLPVTSEEIPCEKWSLDAESDVAGERVNSDRPLFGFVQHEPAVARLPLKVNPSAISAATSTMNDKVQIGQRIGVQSGVHMDDLGTAMHACLAMAMSDPVAPLSSEDIQRLLDGHSVGDSASPEAIQAQVEAFKHWLEQKWPGATATVEVPIQSVLGNGQVLDGRIDLLLETEGGWILVDHKSAPFAFQDWDRLVEKHGGQLDAYAQAVEKATGRPVLEKWLYLPIAGGAVSIH